MEDWLPHRADTLAEQTPSRIFVVDNESLIATTLAAILERNGYRASSFTESQEALQAARLFPPDLLISDVAMPRISGIELAIQIRESHPRCSVLLFSGQPETATLLERARLRGHSFELLNKPIHPVEFLERIRIVIHNLPS